MVTADGRVVVEVPTGEVRVAGRDTVLAANALGSCIAVIAHDRRGRAGGIAHVMLPGCCPDSGSSSRLRYAEDAIDELLFLLSQHGILPDDLDVCVAGAGNVLRRPDDTVCTRNIVSVVALLNARGITTKAGALGGFLRRKVRLDIASGVVWCAEGEGKEEILWNPS